MQNYTKCLIQIILSTIISLFLINCIWRESNNYVTLIYMRKKVTNKYDLEEKVEIFEDEFLPHIHSIYNFAYRITFDEDDAKDLVQETFLKSFRCSSIW